MLLITPNKLKTMFPQKPTYTCVLHLYTCEQNQKAIKMLFFRSMDKKEAMVYLYKNIIQQ